MTKFRLSILAIVWISISADARTFAGRVVDEAGEPLPYSTVRVQRRPIAVMSDTAGNFAMPMERVRPTDTVSISFIGYTPLRLPAASVDADSAYTFRLTPTPMPLNEVTVSRSKSAKLKKQGNKRNTGLFKCMLDGQTAGDTFGYEVHAKKNRRMLLDKVGFFFLEGERQMQRMKFRINVYDMNGVKKGPTSLFRSILPKPVYFDFTLGEEKSGKFVFSLPEFIVLPADALVEIEFLENLGDDRLYYKGNLLGKKTWSRSLKYGDWDTTPFSTPFFIECVEESV